MRGGASRFSSHNHQSHHSYQQQHQNHQSQQQQQQEFTAMKGPSLLQKLLHKEIRREQSLLLQCFRYIIDEKFFVENPEEELSVEVREKLDLIQSRMNDEMKFWNAQYKSTATITTGGEQSSSSGDLSGEKPKKSTNGDEEEMVDEDDDEPLSDKDEGDELSDDDDDGEFPSAEQLVSKQEEEEVEAYMATLQNLSGDALKELGFSAEN